MIAPVITSLPKRSLAGTSLVCGSRGLTPHGPIENSELLWPNAEGRYCSSKPSTTLHGKIGQYTSLTHWTRATSSVRSAAASYNVVTTLDVIFSGYVASLQG